MPNIGFSELIVIFLIILLIFGAEKIPKIGKAIGEGIREFKKGQQPQKSEHGENK